MRLDPRYVHLSEHFVLSDFLGCHSVYSKGYRNDFVVSPDDPRLENGAALCQTGLEPIMAEYGPLSVAYGAIGPELSDKIVHYQDPRKPSHHLWNLGAAADILVHRWIAGEFPDIEGLCLPESAIGAPIALAHAIDYWTIPYSRMITYSESPYICLAVSAREVDELKPRRAFYENRYPGKAKAKPDYRQYSNTTARVKAFEHLQENGLPHPWEGAGYPTYHGGGFCQYQHMRVSKYTMVSDWLFDLQSISTGEKNIPSLNSEAVQDAFAAAGLMYDWIIGRLDIHRASIVAGYVSPLNSNFDRRNDWRKQLIRFELKLPQSFDIGGAYRVLSHAGLPCAEFGVNDDFLVVNVEVDATLASDIF